MKFRAARGGDFDCPKGKPWHDDRWLPQDIPADVTERKEPVRVQVPINAIESARRFGICKTCDESSESGHKCALHKGCCFGRWRANPDNKCPQGKWEILT